MALSTSGYTVHGRSSGYPACRYRTAVVHFIGIGHVAQNCVGGNDLLLPVFINTLTGLTIIDEDEKELFRPFVVREGQNSSDLTTLGNACNFAGLKTAISLALIGAIVGEFVSADQGLGLLIQRFSFQLNTPAAYAVLFSLTALGLLLYVYGIACRYIIFWNRNDRMLKRTRMERRYERKKIVT